MQRHSRWFAHLWLVLAASACQSEPEGLAKAGAASVHVKIDFDAKPLPEIPLPNDLATRYDASSPTLRRINASQLADTNMESRTRQLVDQLDGWGTYSPISVPFDGPIDPKSLMLRHHGDDYAFADDAVYLVDITEGSPTFGQPRELDVGNGNFPQVLEQIGGYWRGDARGDSLTLSFEEHDEDANGNGALDPGEDDDLDGVLDKPNYLPGVTKKPGEMNLAERADALMTFYERETNTLLLRPLVPLRERTTYAVLVTRRVLDLQGKPVGSPGLYIHHLQQTEALRPLEGILASHGKDFGGLGLGDIAFAWSFTTGSIEADLRAVRQGLYGTGAQKHLHEAYPPQLGELLPLFDNDPKHPKFETKYTLSGESFQQVAQLIIAGGLVGTGGPEQSKRFGEALKYVGVHFFGTYQSPQLFDRQDKDGHYLGYNDMSWPPDVASKKAKDRSETVTFWAMTPRKEATPDGKPRGIVILGHGYTGNKTEAFSFGPYLARMGFITIAIDNVSHGFTLGKQDSALLTNVFGGFGLLNLAKALTSNRNWDQDLDGLADSGADFWTAYTFHTRDVVRQTAVDYMQLVRILRAFDGKTVWPVDLNGNGKLDDLAGDTDGDGVVDVGGPTMPIFMMGGSLGGIMSAVMGGVETEISAVVPVSGGGGLIDVGVRSIQGGVRESVQLRLMGPLYVSTPNPATSTMSIHTIVPSLNDTYDKEVASVPAELWGQLAAGDSVRADNVSNFEYDCARLFVDKGCLATCTADAAVADKQVCTARCLAFRVGLASDITVPPQRHLLTFYKGDAFVSGQVDRLKHKACAVKLDAKKLFVVDQFTHDIAFHYRSAPLQFKAGEALAPLAEGLGLHRARPELRKFFGFAQMVLDPADPAVWASHFFDADMGTHAIVLNTIGDMNVPVNTGAAIGRAAGLLDWKKKIAEWGGRTVNQTVIDTYVLEAVDKIPRFLDGSGNGLLFDVEDLSQSATPVAAGQSSLPPQGQKVQLAAPAPEGKDGWPVPRLSPPLHTHAIGPDQAGGQSGTFFPYVEPEGKHGFWNPGEQVDALRARCKSAAGKAGQDPATCDKQSFFDHGAMVMHAIGLYLGSGGKVWPELKPCMSDGQCGDIQPVPENRKD